MEQYDRDGARLADVTLTSALRTRIVNATAAYPGTRLNPWRLATFSINSRTRTAEVKLEGGTFTAVHYVDV